MRTRTSPATRTMALILTFVITTTVGPGFANSAPNAVASITVAPLGTIHTIHFFNFGHSGSCNKNTKLFGT